jgi:hypothetical protein
VYTSSYPKYTKEARHFPNVFDLIAPYKPTSNDLLIILGRDATITEISAKKHGAFSSGATQQAILHNILYWEQCDGKVAFFSYELFVWWKEIYLGRFLSSNGIDHKINYDNIQYNDGNQKYIKVLE